MPRIRRQDHVVIDSEIYHGEPCIKGTRIPLSVIAGSIAEGMTFDEVVSEYPQLTREAIQAALAHAARSRHGKNPGSS